MEYSFASEIAESDYPLILESRIFKDWLAATSAKFNITKIHFTSVDFLRNGRQPLFIKLNATATLPDGRPVHGIVLVRGNAVGILVVLRCEGKKYLLLVKQPRFAISEQIRRQVFLTALRTKAETIEKSQGFFDTLTQLVKELWSAA